MDLKGPSLAALVACLMAFGCRNALEPNTELGLRVWVEVRPGIMSLSDSLAAVRIRVCAQNPSAREVRIVSGGPPYVMAGDPANGRGFAHAYRLAHGDNLFTAGPTVDWGWDSVYVFAPRSGTCAETEQRLREWRRDGTPADTGVYRVRSFFNAREGAYAMLRIIR